MAIKDRLEAILDEEKISRRVELPEFEDMSGYMVYILSHDDNAIVVGHGRKDRAKVILGGEKNVSPPAGHIKALLVHLYKLYGGGSFEKFIIKCNSKEEAKEIEKHIHKRIGGNKNELPQKIREELFNGITEKSLPDMLLRMALISSYCGISDLTKWRRNNIIDDKTWGVLKDRLRLKDTKVEKKHAH